MAESTGIAWADATFNPWVGCEKVSPGCAHCYAETLVTGRMARAGTWGADGVRQRTSPSNWKKPLRWAKLARRGRLPDGSYNEDGHRPRVFCASLADVFENRPELDEWRTDLFDLVCDTPELDWLVLTKRPEFARAWADARLFAGRPQLPPNVWLGVSIENARHTYRADVLRQIPAAVRFISAEPLLGSLFETHVPAYSARPGHSHKRALDLTGVDWIIVGGESGPGARPFHLEHAREIVRAATELGYENADPASYSPYRRPALFVKQLGAKPHEIVDYGGPRNLHSTPLDMRDRKGGDWDEWPADLRIREFPRSAA